MKWPYMIQPKILVGLQKYIIKKLVMIIEVKVVLWGIGNLMNPEKPLLQIIQEMVITELLLPYLETPRPFQLGS